jgi:60 kDa SS-A/Ro ribonucleoprotein
MSGYLARQAAQQRVQQRTDAHEAQNNAGGFSFQVDQWQQLTRFLVLGSAGGTYYVNEQKLTADNADAVIKCIKADGVCTVGIIQAISHAGRAPKNDPALFALALCFKHGNKATRDAATEAFPNIVRIGTHLLHFMQFADAMKALSSSSGKSALQAVRNWYQNERVQHVAYQLMKYQSRDKWAQRDALMLAHAKPQNAEQAVLFNWVRRGWEGVGNDPHPMPALQQIWAMERAKKASSAEEVCWLINTYNLPREAIPTNWLNDKQVMQALFTKMPLTALIRSLSNYTAKGFYDSSESVEKVVQRITDSQSLRASRVHPFQMLIASYTYASGRSLRGSSTWTPNPIIVQALNGGFLNSFHNAVPIGNRIMVGLDVSGSMWSGTVNDVPGFTPALAGGALAYFLSKTEQFVDTMAFTASTANRWSGRTTGPDIAGFVPFNVGNSLQHTLAVTQSLSHQMGATDCALPMLYGAQKKVDIDTFIVITDSETWAGHVSPAQALRDYRAQRQSLYPAKLVVLAMVSNPFTIADPKDAGMLDIAGFDAATPALLADFAGNRLFSTDPAPAVAADD